MSSDQRTILVVDDRPANRYSIVHALTRSGFAVIEAESGREALELAKQVPAAILLDVKLPDILGYEVCRRLKSNPRTSHIPVLQLSAAFVDNESRVYALESGADAYLTQPVEPNVLIATVKSLVKLHEAESLAKLASKQWQATFDALGEGVALIDPHGRIQRCNRAMTQLLRRSYVEIENSRVDQLLRETLSVELPYETTVKPLEVFFESQSFRLNLEPVYLDDVKTGSILILSDITRQKLAEHAALVNERLAATGRLAHTIAHEINNPLEAITNLLYLLRGPVAESTEGTAYLLSAEKEVERVSRISRQILSFHRESSVQIAVDLPGLMEDVLALNNRELIERNLRVVKEWDRQVIIHAFPAQLRQVFSNVIRNAIEASYQGAEIRIRISKCMLYREPREPGARVTICDNGIGIHPQHLHRVFDAFFTTKELKGTGVGLWLSSTIVQEHRGRIQLRSCTRVKHSGTCFSILLPARGVWPEEGKRFVRPTFDDPSAPGIQQRSDGQATG
jgi:two-component system, NtrC family, sensor kinase